MSENALEHDVPSNGSFELTPLCNLNCRMCYVHLQDPSVKEKLLSGKQRILLFQGGLMLNDTGAFIFSNLAEKRTVEEVAAKLAEEYDVSLQKAKEDVIKTVHSLKEAGVWAD